jgi:uncharacterized protein (DUF4415 family)
MGKTTVTLLDGAVYESQTDWDAVKAMTNEEVVAGILSDPDARILTHEELKHFRKIRDIPGDTLHEKNIFLRNEALARKAAKSDKDEEESKVSIDKDIRTFFTALGGPIDVRINAVIREYMSDFCKRHSKSST